ncbi:hypothetical protein QT970_26820, partial [Microcoleus sp. herbarium8]|uniref:hypothetical protein n=1 Tax=Microcoleus sp. herbarium8 TaxID=3055436 RepID=UPI002FD5F60A
GSQASDRYTEARTFRARHLTTLDIRVIEFIYIVVYRVWGAIECERLLCEFLILLTAQKFI